jgi:drug/metabolite transporter (DMT)-like permease
MAPRVPASSNAAPATSAHAAGLLPIVALLGVGLLWSTGGVLIKHVSWPPLAIWSVRSLIAAAVIVLVKRPSWRNITGSEWMSGVALAATMALFIAANKYTTAANAILIQYSAPAWAALLGWLVLGERASRLDGLTVAVALGGIALFFFDKLTLDHNLGNAFALIAGFTFAVHAVLLRKIAQQGGAPSRAMLLGYLIAVVGGAPAALGAGALPTEGALAMLALGVLQQAVPALLYAWAIQRVTALEGLLIPIVEPLLSPVWVWLVIGERPGPWALLGGVIVVGVITARALLKMRPAARSGAG